MSFVAPLVLLSPHRPTYSSASLPSAPPPAFPPPPGRLASEQPPRDVETPAYPRPSRAVAQISVPRLPSVAARRPEGGCSNPLRRGDHSSAGSASSACAIPEPANHSAVGQMEQPGRVFHSFSKLPLEIRLAIWNLNISHPRILPIHLYAASPSEDPVEDSYAQKTAPQCASLCPAPANLYVCRESRAEALKHHRLSFGMYRSRGRIFFNPESDILYFGRRDGYGASEAQFCTVMTLCAPEDLARVKRLAVSEAVFKVGCKYVHSLTTDVLGHLRSRMPGLEELVFVPAGEHDESWSWDGYGYGTDVELVDVESSEEMAGMAVQVQAAVQDFCERHPEWRRPQCRVMALKRGPKTGGTA